jgi:hypothetical protein
VTWKGSKGSLHVLWHKPCQQKHGISRRFISDAAAARQVQPGKLCRSHRIHLLKWFAVPGAHAGIQLAGSAHSMSQLSSPMPPVPVAAPLPQSAASNATTRAGEQANAASVVDQFAKLLEALAQTEQTTSPMMTPAAAGDQSAIPPGASAPLEADPTATEGTATAASPTVQPQVSLPEPLITAAAVQAPDAQAVRPRDAASGKPKAEPVTPARRAALAPVNRRRLTASLPCRAPLWSHQTSNPGKTPRYVRLTTTLAPADWPGLSRWFPLR